MRMQEFFEHWGLERNPFADEDAQSDPVFKQVMAAAVRRPGAAKLASDPLGSLICYGMATVIFVQTFVAVGMNLGLLPVTGLTLPFVSSGGSSLVTLLMGLGLVQSVLLRHEHSHFRY